MARAAILRACGAAYSLTSTTSGFRLQLSCPTRSYLKLANFSVPLLCCSLESSAPTSAFFTLHRTKNYARMGGQRSKGTERRSVSQFHSKGNLKVYRKRNHKPGVIMRSSAEYELKGRLDLFICAVYICSDITDSFHSSVVAFSSGQNDGGSKEILVQHLLVSEDNAKLLLEIQKKIAGGADLSDLAVEYSICPSKENGGMLGWVRKGQLVSEFEQAAFNAPLNKVIKCKTKFGWHLLQVLSERGESLLGEITPEEFHMKMQHPDFMEEAQLIDVREPEEVALASLPGFKVLPLRQFGSWGPNISNEFDPEKDTYILCHQGVRSLQVAQWLQTQGFKRVFNISGGIHAYAVKADASIPIY